MEVTVSRTQKSLLNARINVVFYVLALALSYFSRRTFLEVLGTQFVGFSGTVGNFLGFLNLAEMGTAMAVSFALYKPLLEKDQTRIAEIVSVTGFLYRRIGIIMTAAGVILSLFLPLIFPHPGFPMSVVYFAWYSFLVSSVLSYFLNYGQVLLDADQRNYIVTAWLQTTMLAKIFLQIIVLSKFQGGYYSWIAIELVAGLTQALMLRRKIRQTYPYLHPDIRAGKNFLHLHPGITTSIKQLSVHKFADFALISTKEFFIYLFTSLTVVAYYGNYVIILVRLNQLLLTVLTSMQAGIGHLIAEDNIDRTISVFWEIMALRYFTSGIFVFAVYQFISPFVALWLGHEFILSRWILFLMLSHGFLMQVRDTVLSFVQGYGLFDDIAAPIVETVLNIGLSLGLGYLYGMQGVLIGSFISIFAIAYVWKPFYLFRRGFQRPVSTYWKELSKYLLLVFASWWIGDKAAATIRFIDPYKNYASWIAWSAIVVAMYALILFVMMYPLSGMRRLVRRLVKRFAGR